MLQRWQCGAGYPYRGKNVRHGARNSRRRDPCTTRVNVSQYSILRCLAVSRNVERGHSHAKKASTRFALTYLIAAAAVASAQSSPGPHAIAVSGASEYVHDPSIIKDGRTWYLFATANGPKRDGELPIRCSSDPHEWKRCGNVFDQMPD
jgi:hypothetical protein